MDLIQAMHISSSALRAHRTKMNIVAENLANTETTRTEAGGPYRRKMVVFEEKPLQSFRQALAHARDRRAGVEVTEVVEAQNDYRMVYNPSHPDADPDTGYVAMPNVNLLTEIADMMVARRSFDASVTAIANARSMVLKALEIGK